MVTKPVCQIDEQRTQLQAVRDIFINEATSAPRLFSDLAKMEQYIAESYKTRSFIELIQNADDAGAKRFGIHQIGSDLIVGNDGHVFTPEDVEALCRSGSSHKVRGQQTIGYRGIGFKSVVNISKRIFVLSGEYVFGFDRAETMRQFPSLTNVPLIRIPFVPSPKEVLLLKSRVAAIQNRSAYKTIFIFESGGDRLVADELSAIDRHAFLFLRSVQTIEIELPDRQRSIEIGRAVVEGREVISLRDGDATDSWLLLRHPQAQCDVVAFKLQDGEIVSAEQSISVVHSFLPTTEAAGARLKINGDYSTDPSRKSIDLDEASQASFEHASTLIAKAIQKSIEDGGIPGILRPLTAECSPGRFKRLLHESLAKHFEQTEVLVNGRKRLLRDLRLRPEWLNYEDYVALCAGEGLHIGTEVISRLPELPDLLERLGTTRLLLSEALAQVNLSHLSPLGAAQIVAKCANQYRYDLTAERVSFLQEICLFPVNDRLVKASDVKSLNDLEPEFKAYLFDAVPPNDLGPFLSKLAVSFDVSGPVADRADHQDISPSSVPSRISTAVFTSGLTRWRSAEKNAEEYFRALPGVLTVTDVTVANMGYDLEVVYSSGQRLFVEVKSVKTFNEPIKITNNEYASAHKHGSTYCLAIAINGDRFEMMVVRDPIRSLMFQKQIERWSWLCESYVGKLELPLNVNVTVGSE